MKVFMLVLFRTGKVRISKRNKENRMVHEKADRSVNAKCQYRVRSARK